jgi:hypothetical protein
MSWGHHQHVIGMPEKRELGAPIFTHGRVRRLRRQIRDRDEGRPKDPKTGAEYLF